MTPTTNNCTSFGISEFIQGIRWTYKAATVNKETAKDKAERKSESWRDRLRASGIVGKYK